MADDTQPSGSQDETLRLHVWERRKACVHKLKVSALYHLKRSRWFEILDRGTTGFAIIGSAGAVISLIKPVSFLGMGAELWLSGAVAVVSTLGLVFAWGQKARQHAELARDFRKLLAEVERAGHYPTAEQIDGFNADAVALDSLEPSPMTVVQTECENQLAISAGGAPLVRLPWHQRLLKHVIDFPPIAPAA